MIFRYVSIIIIAYCIYGVAWGIATNRVLEEKGYDDNWFVWGFFFGFIAYIVASNKPDISERSYQSDRIYDEAEKRKNEDIMQSGGWKCSFCQRINEYYVTTCTCGKSREESDRNIAKSSVEENQMAEAPEIAILRKLQTMYQSQLITEEEYAAKRKEILDRM